MKEEEFFESTTNAVRSALEHWLKLHFGEKCEEYEHSCECCQRWRLAEELLRFDRHNPSDLKKEIADLVECLRWRRELDAELDAQYLLQNVTAGYVGNSPVFWREGGSGYTQWIDEAKRWTNEEAETQVRSTSGTHQWVIWKLSSIEKAAKRTVDIQDLR